MSRLEDCGPKKAPKPETDAAWTALCRDPQWQYKKLPVGDQPILYYSEPIWRPDDYWGEKCRIKAVPVPDGMHDGALAATWVFETMPSDLSRGEDNMDSYMKRLICAVTGRFVLIERPDANDGETLVSTSGKPKPGVRYRWRFWDNTGKVYDDLAVKYMETFFSSTTHSWDEVAGGCGILPGDFRPGLTTWMRFSTENFDPFYIMGLDPVDVQAKGKMATNLNDFWECMWKWKHDGSTTVPEWDERLHMLARSAGVPPDPPPSWVLHEDALDNMAFFRDWEKIETRQPGMASYRKDDMRLNFYLSTGTVGSCLDHPRHGKTQLFRRQLKEDESAVALFDNPRQHTGKGYYTKKRKAPPH